jgi:phi13 family phage major tail protein
MAYIGLKYPVFAPISSETPGSVPAYGQGKVVGMAIEANVSIELGDNPLFGDDVIAESDKSFVSGSITIGVDDIGKEVYLAWFGGETQTGDGGVEEIVDGAGIPSPLGGFGYYRVRRKNGVRSIRAFWYYKTQWGVPSEEAQTKGEQIEWQTPSVEGSIMTLDDEKASWRKWADFTSEADAKAWLNEMANIGEPADLTALNAAIASAQELDPEDYTSASWVAVANALAEAIAVAAMDSPSQTRVDSATSLLTTAVGLLEEAVSA